MLSFRRARRHAAWYATIALVAAIVSGTAVALAGVLSVAADAGVRDALAARAGADLAFRASVDLGEDPATQDEQVRAAIADSLAGITTAPEVSRSVTAEVTLRRDDGPARAGVALSSTDLGAHAGIVDGRWASDADEATMQADAAARLGVLPGSLVTIKGTVLTVTGLWRVTDPLDPRWLGDPQVLDGRGDGFGPVLVDETVLSIRDADASVQWTIVPDTATATADDLEHFAEAWAGAPRDWRGRVDEISGFKKTGRLAATSTALLAQVNGLRAVEPVALLMLSASGIIAVAELARLVIRGRSAEYQLLWARGRGEGDNARSAAIGVAVAVASGAAPGVAAGMLVATLVGSPAPPLTSGAVVVAVLLGTGAIAAARTAQLASRGAAGSALSARAGRIAAPALALLAVAAAAVSVWQLRLYGSPVTPLSDGSSGVDPLAVTAPTLALLAVILASLVAFPPLARLLARRTPRSSAVAMLSTLTVARDLPRSAARIVVVALAFGSVAVAAAYAGTWTQSFQRTSELRTGSDVSVSAPTGGFATEQLAAVDALEHVQTAALVTSSGIQLGDTGATLVGVPADAFRTLATTGAGAIDPAAIAAAVRADVPALTVPSGATETLDVVATGFSAPPRLVVRILDANGRLGGVEAASTVMSADHLSYSFTVPESGTDAPGRVLALEITAGAGAVFGSEPATFTVAGGTSGGDWSPAGDSADPVADGGFVAAPFTSTVRLVPSSGPDLAHPPVAVSRALADRYGITEGDPLTFGLEGAYAQIDARIVAVIDAVPSSPTDLAVLVDSAVLTASALAEDSPPPAATSLWVESDDPVAAAAELRDALPPSSSIRVSGDPSTRSITGAAALGLWAVAACCIVLALVTVAALAGADLRRRMPEVAVLRAIGLRPREQAALRRSEGWSVLGFAAVVGAVAGLTATALTVRELVTAAVPDAVASADSPPAVDVVGVLAALCILAAGIAATVVATGTAVARESRRARVDGVRE